MPSVWSVEPEWDGEDAFVIGGGPSLRSFNWRTIAGRHTIGTNAVPYVVGSHVVEIALWGDWRWWNSVGRDLLEEFGGRVVGTLGKTYWKRVMEEDCNWLHLIPRGPLRKLSTDPSHLGWFGNTGAAGINLALLLGAKRVFLLGFDMKLSGEGRANFHDIRIHPDSASVYVNFLRQMKDLAKGLPEAFPDCEVINVNDDSAMDTFPTWSVAKLETCFNGKIGVSNG